MQLKEVQIEKIKFMPDMKRVTDWGKRKFLRSIIKEGIISPPILWKKNEDEYICIDGNLRIKFARELGYKKIKAVILEGLDEAKAKRARVLLNTIKFKPDTFKLGMILRELDDSINDILMINENVIEALKEGVMEYEKVKKMKRKGEDEEGAWGDVKVKIRFRARPKVFAKLMKVLSQIGERFKCKTRDEQFVKLIKLLYGAEKGKEGGDKI